MTANEKVEILDVTPEMAIEWLDQNAGNRTVSKKHVALLAQMMIRNEWHFVGDPVRFDQEGKLLDGQHRLLALIESETTQRMVVIHNLPAESQVYMDAGRRRSPGDQLMVALGMRNGTRAAAIVRTYLAWRDEVFLSETRKIGIPEIVTWATDNQTVLHDAVTNASRVIAASIPTSAAVSGAVFLAARRLDPGHADYFWARLADGVELDATDPILTLRNGIIRRARRDRWTRVEEWAYYARCWNTWRRDGSLLKLQGWRDGITLENLRLR